jgi:pimeloyl-ACP methyl ester carboxylesterase
MILPVSLALGALGLAAAATLAWRRLRQRTAARVLAIDPRRGIDEAAFVRLGGIEQWVGIRGDDRDNPIVLIVHGGPGAPASIFAPRLRAWERHFTIVQWDQRGAGKTFGKNRRRGHGPLTTEQLVADGLALVEHVCARLGQERVILLTSSAGTMLGVPMVKRRPDRFSAWVATDLNVDTRAGEQLGHQLALARLRAVGHSRGVAALEQLGSEPYYWDQRAWERKQSWLARTDPLAKALGPGLLLPSLVESPLHSLGDLSDFVAGLRHCQTARFSELMAWDARQWGLRFEVPVFWFHGEADVFTPTALAADYFADVEAPWKEAALIRGAGHLAAFVQPEQLLMELLTRVRPHVFDRTRALPPLAREIYN